MKKFLVLLVVLIMVLLVGCGNQAERVSQNLSQEADNFNVTRQLTVINARAEDGNNAILFQMTGNFSINIDSDGDLNIIGENPGGAYYKHFVRLSRDITYIVEDLGATNVSKYRFEINFNPKMIVPVQPTVID